MKNEIIQFILEFKWVLLLAFEIIAWAATIMMFYSRYFLNSSILFWISTLLAALTGYLPHLALAIFDYYYEGKINSFIFFILFLLSAGLLTSKKLIPKIDQSLMNWANRDKGTG
jgi:hypothetical protein